jgi:hypothetical protein
VLPMASRMVSQILWAGGFATFGSYRNMKYTAPKPRFYLPMP